MNKGFKEAFGALGITAAVAILIAFFVWVLTGCTETSVGVVPIDHRSSIQDFRDHCEDNLAGVDVRMALGKNCGKYCPEVTVMSGWNLRSGGACQGRDPIGDVKFRFPVWSNR